MEAGDFLWKLAFGGQMTTNDFSRHAFFGSCLNVHVDEHVPRCSRVFPSSFLARRGRARGSREGGDTVADLAAGLIPDAAVVEKASFIDSYLINAGL